MKDVSCLHGDGPDDAMAWSDQHLHLASTMFQALSDPARLRLLLWLARREMCVTELVELENAKLSSISARLQLLHGARLVTRRRDAKHIFYALADDHVRTLLDDVLAHAAETH